MPPKDQTSPQYPTYSFDECLSGCRKIIREYIPSGILDIDSKVYAYQIGKDLRMLGSYMQKGMLLDVGCGKGHISAILTSFGFNVVGLDLPTLVGEFQGISEAGWQLRLWRRFENEFKVKYVVGTAEDLPFESNSFDGVLSYACVEHIPPEKLDMALREIRRILKKGGYFFIFRLPRRYSYAEHLASLFKMWRHEILYSEKEILILLGKHDFDVLKIARTDMVIGFPPIFPKVWNHLFPLLMVINEILLRTPLSFFSHHMCIVCRKGE
jgi:SAM-dependent methyltransferase